MALRDPLFLWFWFVVLQPEGAELFIYEEKVLAARSNSTSLRRWIILVQAYLKPAASETQININRAALILFLQLL